jgi:hypothetical protein
MTTFGEISWNDDVFAGDKKQTNSKDLFIRLDEGSNEMRIVTQPFQYLVHKYKKEDDKGFGQKVHCSMMHGSCPLCATGDKAKARWLLGVISRKTGTYKILDISFAVFGQIRKYARATRWGDPTKYDIDIIVDKNGGATGYYSVQAIPKEPLSAEDQKVRDTQVDLDDLKRRVTPPSAEVVQKRIDKINGVVSADAPVSADKKASAKTAPKAVTATVSMTDDEELEESFPDHDEAQA